MPLLVRKKLPHTIPQWVPDGSWFFITFKCVPPGKNQLCQLDDGREGRTRSPLRAALESGRAASPLTAAIGAHGVTRPTTVGDRVLAAMKHNHDKLIWHCHLCLLMPDHLHAIIAFPRESSMKTTVSNWKKYVAVKFGVEWQRDFFDHRLRDHHELQEKTNYILMNPVRKGLCERMVDWPWVYRPVDRPPPIPG
jgi:REP element-mobilizing transposase RayT